MIIAQATTQVEVTGWPVCLESLIDVATSLYPLYVFFVVGEAFRLSNDRQIVFLDFGHGNTGSKL